MMGDLIILAKYGTPEEAHLLRNELEAAGVRVFLENETTAAWAWHFSNAFGGVKLLVPEEDLEAARELLAELGQRQAIGRATPSEERAAGDRPPASWTCAACHAEVDAGMDVCWACGAAADGTAALKFEGESASQAEPKERRAPAPEVALVTVLFPPALAYFFFTKLCHVLAPLVPDAKAQSRGESKGPERSGEIGVAAAAGGAFEPEEPASEPPVARSESDLDAVVLRAWRAALMGFFLLPPLVMTLYSTWLLAQYWFRRSGANRRRDRLALWTLAINLMAALCLGFILAWEAARFLHTMWRVRYLGH